ncbi:MULTISPECIES: 16S rRNA (cytidine(1402)-2'-O)-methyltransferase [Staphylococcus]|jgi:16S rRNA (cytidine1402-2'-O)-methyltransferase|uniref:Ribosomal RNA small subunit methyltransferase I n=1 Tax=Staphylococcus nepalensis TaxID=214473 RepID=A0A291JNC9_9STAP|nr:MULTISPECIES: 16S rRNA (cytidine(1402)-2'-O)-methyltransferase [Staphylococcus]VDG68103.1 uroporphyrin-III C/tetrapyrrole (Corrin/Porphyrin) methyltransferase [Lacrimispora indolis]ATH61085.1 16S rRNA (cytidine(1402)-2'-O)-methyltransferase [Staphylococcus nepalensis]ATH66115.1 16S rRNA (cytidine(1402)-2'-O)-methyltransferase [Staphylococcus nepalensis]AWI45505.1 16S rRNA (cytidine(1402)-2'-O)-methyltransferase [Staphylococcus nepalensis]MBO1207034.1 16S rRNA (cytidine(1402)-2'-O)-methyltra
MGILYLVGTPIGNLADITYRAVNILRSVDMIACEDTRVTKKLCTHYEIHAPLKSYHDHNKEQQTEYLIQQLNEDVNIALVSDAGLPLISDPGHELVVAARAKGIRVETVPGPNAGLTALMASGLPSFTYTFLGFLPRKEKAKYTLLEQRMFEDSTLIIYESPHRVKDTLKTVQKIDAQRYVSLGRELTKKFEQIVTEDVDTLLLKLDKEEIPTKGEFVIVIEGAVADEDTSWFEDMSINEHVEYYVNQNMKPKAAIKQVAEERRMKTSEVYDIYHNV